MLKQDNNQIYKLETKISILEEKIIKLERIILTNNLNKNDYIENNNTNNNLHDSYNVNDEVNLDTIPINRCIDSLLIEPKLVRQYAFDNRM